MSGGCAPFDATTNLTQQAPRNDTSEGRIRIGCVDAGTLRPCRIPTDPLNAPQ